MVDHITRSGRRQAAFFLTPDFTVVPVELHLDHSINTEDKVGFGMDPGGSCRGSVPRCCVGATPLEAIRNGYDWAAGRLDEEKTRIKKLEKKRDAIAELLLHAEQIGEQDDR